MTYPDKVHVLEARIVARAVETDISAIEVVSNVSKFCIKLTRALTWSDVSTFKAGTRQDEQDRHAVTS